MKLLDNDASVEERDALIAEAGIMKVISSPPNRNVTKFGELFKKYL